MSEPEASERGSSLIGVMRNVSQYIKGAKNLISFISAKHCGRFSVRMLCGLGIVSENDVLHSPYSFPGAKTSRRRNVLIDFSCGNEAAFEQDFCHFLLVDF